MILISAVPFPCLPGSFTNVTQQTVCMDCPAGFYCVNGDKPQICPRGKYCPVNTTADIPKCPPGTFNGNLGKESYYELVGIGNS